jgi:hypothetical protein
MPLGIGRMFIEIRLGHRLSICSVDFAIPKSPSIPAGCKNGAHLIARGRDGKQ